MNLKQIEKATKIVEQIKVLDLAIIALDKMAIKILDVSQGITLNLSVELPKENSKESILDSDGSLKTGTEAQSNPYTFIINWNPLKQNEVKTNSISINETLTDTCALQLIGVLILEKQTQRKTLIDKLRTMGAKIE